MAAGVRYLHSGDSGGGGLSGERGVPLKQRGHSVRGWPCAEARGGEEGTLSQSRGQRSVTQQWQSEQALVTSPQLRTKQGQFVITFEDLCS